MSLMNLNKFCPGSKASQTYCLYDNIKHTAKMTAQFDGNTIQRK